MFASPFTKLSVRGEKKLTSSLFCLLIITSVVMLYFDGYLTNEITPYGIVSFELANTLENSLNILNSWDAQAKIFAGLSLGFDFLFLLIYTLFIALLTHKLNTQLWRNKPFYRIGELLIWTMFLTAIFDAIENVGLIKLLLGDHYQLWSSMAFYFALAKFIFIIVGILYILINTGCLLYKKFKDE
mgnify:CR=1 FL=1